MTREEAMLIEDLNIEVTPLVEDAFYAFRPIDCKELDKRLERLGDKYEQGDPETDALMDKYKKDLDASDKARERFMQAESKDRVHALVLAFQMIDNIQQYGYPCLEWMPE